MAAAAVACLGLSGCGFQGLYNTSLPGGADVGNHPFEISVMFTNVLDLVPQSAVKVNDIPVGKVTTISLADHCSPSTGPDVWCAKVKVQVNGSVNLPSNARAEVKQTSLLGEKYVDLMQPVGAPAASKLANGSTIPLAKTQSAPEAEEVLGALSLLLNNGGLQQIKVIATELNGALHGNESAVRDLIGQLNTFTGTLGGQVNKITNALDSIDQLAITLNRQKNVLTAALDNFPPALRILSQERSNLTRLLVSLSNLGNVAKNVINATQTDFVAALKSLDPTLIELAKAGDDLPKSLRILGTFPFPLGTTRTLVKGDYANLDAVLNLNLTQQLCALLGSPLAGTPLPAALKSVCAPQQVGTSHTATKIGSTSSAASATATPATNPGGGSPGSVGAADMPSMLIGAGK